MANTYVKIGSTVTVGVLGAATIDFTSIPATYTDLQLVMSVRSSNATNGDLVEALFNSTASSITGKRLEGVVSGSPYVASDSLNVNQAGAQRIYVGACSAALDTASTFGSVQLYVPNYAGSTNKSTAGDGVGENNASTNTLAISAGLWSNSAAITTISISLFRTGASFVQYSTATLYGILKS